MIGSPCRARTETQAPLAVMKLAQARAQIAPVLKQVPVAAECSRSDLFIHADLTYL